MRLGQQGLAAKFAAVSILSFKKKFGTGGLVRLRNEDSTLRIVIYADDGFALCGDENVAQHRVAVQEFVPFDDVTDG